jgi:hypothetical protein
MNGEVNINDTYVIIEVKRTTPDNKQWYIDGIAKSLCSPRICVVDETIGDEMPGKDVEIDALIIIKKP